MKQLTCSLMLAALLASGSAASAPVATDAQPAQQIYRMPPQDLDRYLAELHQSVPDLRQRVAIIARKTIGQPYKLNLLGEYPFQLHDSLPMVSLGFSDCTVFAEQTYAMALSKSWEEFFWMLQRIRYKDGVIGVATRNHYTELDWNVNNAWLVNDISAELAGPQGPSYVTTADRATFLKTRHHTNSTLPVQTGREAYVALDQVQAVLARMADGDMVNIVSQRANQTLVTHVGLVVLDQHGQRNLLHSSEPEVREEPFAAFIERAQAREQRNEKAGKQGTKLLGFKFLRLNPQPVVPPAAPQPRPA